MGRGVGTGGGDTEQSKPRTDSKKIANVYLEPNGSGLNAGSTPNFWVTVGKLLNLLKGLWREINCQKLHKVP